MDERKRRDDERGRPEEREGHERDGRDAGRDQRHAHGRHGHDHDGGGPRETEFLDLEISKVLASLASGLARRAADELILDAIKVRLRERMGDRIDALARTAADELVDDVEANLDIEARIAARGDARRAAKGKVETLAKRPARTKNAPRKR